MFAIENAIVVGLRNYDEQSRLDLVLRYCAQKNISQEHKAWFYLSGLDKRDKVTISQFLINRLEQEHLNMFEDEETEP